MIKSRSLAPRNERRHERRFATRAILAAALRITIVAASFASLTASATPAAQASPPTGTGSSQTPSQPPQPKNATFGVQPSGTTKPDNRSFFAIGATPGARLTDHFAVRNYSLRPLTLTVQAADALNTPEGDFAVLPPNQPSKEVGAWITLKTSHKLVVPARGVVIVPFTVAVPVNAQPGDHAGGITATLESAARSPTGQTYKLLQSVGSRVFIRVSGPLNPELAIQNLSVRYRDSLNPVDGHAVVSYTVTNVGNVALGGRRSVRLSGLFGLARSAAGLKPLGLLLPGYSVKQSVTVPKIVAQFWMTAHVSIRPLVLPGTVQNVPDAYEANTHFWAIPWLLIAIIVLLVGAWLYRRRRRNRRTPVKRKKAPVSSREPKDEQLLHDQLLAETPSRDD
jgi:Bacterial protein of unknown function (DUF916)